MVENWIGGNNQFSGEYRLVSQEILCYQSETPTPNASKKRIDMVCSKTAKSEGTQITSPNSRRSSTYGTNFNGGSAAILLN